MAIIGLLPPTLDFLPYVDSICSGQAQHFFGFGFRVAVANVATGVDIWSGTANVIPIPPSAGEQMSVVSTSAQDGVAGTGILTLELHYLDANGIQKEEIITMNGVTSVNTIATNIRFINELYAITAGATKAAVGTITIFPVGVPATVYTEIPVGQAKHNNTSRMVPSGKVCLIESFNAAPGAAGSGDTRLMSTSHHGILISVTSPKTIFITNDNIGIFNSGVSHAFETPILVPAFAIIKATAFNVSGTPNIQASWNGKLVTAPV